MFLGVYTYLKRLRKPMVRSMIHAMDRTTFMSTAEKNLDEPVMQMQQLVTLERTFKQYKFGMAVGYLMAAFSIGARLYAIYEFQGNYDRWPQSFAELAADQKDIYVSAPGIALGVAIYKFEKVLAWWNNG